MAGGICGSLRLIYCSDVWRLSMRVQDNANFFDVMKEWQYWLIEHHDTRVIGKR